MTRVELAVPIVAPDLGVPEARVSHWFVAPGDPVDAGERVVELLAGAATFDVVAPAAGRVGERCRLSPDRVVAGQVLGYIHLLSTSERSPDHG